MNIDKNNPINEFVDFFNQELTASKNAETKGSEGQLSGRLKKDDFIDISVAYKIYVYINQNQNELIKNPLNRLGLKVVELQLDRQAKEIKSKTDGFINFLRFLFKLEHRKEMKAQAEYLMMLKDFINQVQESAKAQTFGESQIPGEPEIEKTVKPVNPAAPSSPIVEKKISTPPLKARQKPANTQEAISEFVQLTASPLNSALPPSPAFAPPPPPPAMGLQPAKVTKFFDGEPTKEPTFTIKNVKELTVEEIKEQLSVVRDYVSKMEKALKPIENSLHTIEALRINKKDYEIQLQSFQKKLTAAETKASLFTQTEGNVDLEITMKDNAGAIVTLPIRYYTQAAFDEENTKREANGKKPMYPSMLKSSALNMLEEQIKELKTDVDHYKLKIAELNSDITTIETSENNGVSFSEFKALLDKKKSTMQRWKGALRAREDAIKATEAGKKPPVGASKVVKEAQEVVDGNDPYSQLEKLNNFHIVAKNGNITLQVNAGQGNTAPVA